MGYFEEIFRCSHGCYISVLSLTKILFFLNMWLLFYCYYLASTSIDSNVSPPIVSLSGFRQISIMLYVARSLLEEHVTEKINK